MSKRQVTEEDSDSGVISKYFRCDAAAAHPRRLESTFYQQNCESLAKQLLGKILCRRLAGRVLRGRIVETESYLGVNDGASHSYGGRRTNRNRAMFMEPGTEPPNRYHPVSRMPCTKAMSPATPSAAPSST